MKDLERYYEKKKRGICHLCGAKAYGQVYCDDCREKRRINETARRSAKIRICPKCEVGQLRYKRRLCTECSNPSGKVYRARQKFFRTSLKMQVFAQYGGAFCVCCGEREVAFLTLDHVNNDGAAHRREINKSGWKYFIWLKQNGYPPGYQVLCCNCNRGRWMNGGICPHKLKEK